MSCEFCNGLAGHTVTEANGDRLQLCCACYNDTRKPEGMPDCCICCKNGEHEMPAMGACICPCHGGREEAHA